MEVRNAVMSNGLRHTSRIRTARLSTMTRSPRAGTRWACQWSLDAAEVCGLRSNCWIRGLTANGFFYSEVEMLRSQWNEYSVKILHAVRSAITAIAELLVCIYVRIDVRFVHRPLLNTSVIVIGQLTV